MSTKSNPMSRASTAASTKRSSSRSSSSSSMMRSTVRIASMAGPCCAMIGPPCDQRPECVSCRPTTNPLVVPKRSRRAARVSSSSRLSSRAVPGAISSCRGFARPSGDDGRRLAPEQCGAALRETAPAAERQLARRAVRVAVATLHGVHRHPVGRHPFAEPDRFRDPLQVSAQRDVVSAAGDVGAQFVEQPVVKVSHGIASLAAAPVAQHVPNTHRGPLRRSRLKSRRTGRSSQWYSCSVQVTA